MKGDRNCYPKRWYFIKINYISKEFVSCVIWPLIIITNEIIINITFYNIKTNNELFTKLKSKLPIDLKTNVIYQINCKECYGIYIGQIKHHLKKRIYNHENDCKERNECKNENTALSTHHFKENHDFDFSNIKILDQEEILNKRLIKEMIYIQKNTKSINNKTDIASLSKIYSYLLNM